MQDLHDELYQWLVRAGLCSTMHSGRSQSRVEHVPVPLHGPSPHLELSHHHQRPAGMKASQPYSNVDAALCDPAQLSPQAPCRVGTASALTQELKGEPPPTHC